MKVGYLLFPCMIAMVMFCLIGQQEVHAVFGIYSRERYEMKSMLRSEEGFERIKQGAVPPRVDNMNVDYFKKQSHLLYRVKTREYCPENSNPYDSEKRFRFRFRKPKTSTFELRFLPDGKVVTSTGQQGSWFSYPSELYAHQLEVTLKEKPKGVGKHKKALPSMRLYTIMRMGRFNRDTCVLDYKGFYGSGALLEEEDKQSGGNPKEGEKKVKVSQDSSAGYIEITPAFKSIRISSKFGEGLQSTFSHNRVTE
mmetsp:Transcript_16952/g.26721  ORF Transcript_16952/g.26721 Transcript_16952/m.26721 type:complete len:253 (+) Transcript_16952:94-852(+)|eukprot:CAMPEP_0194580502 /NCGR_PEP_ID=MMETSP0292-20121207/14244_1 /TAXON_ID=39354 /ORGANISM="Heterosigma akashiwo, Strain CCMP2393" /LENGTH=252 /DNA_ID=CAMNT_0039433869 /DNA_START=79 /DNA_END=837 /DNA_ORIENTATION=-